MLEHVLGTQAGPGAYREADDEADRDEQQNGSDMAEPDPAGSCAVTGDSNASRPFTAFRSRRIVT